MYITRPHKSRLGCCSGVQERRQVNDVGLGIVVTQTTRFDPTRLKNRFTYWLELIVDEMVPQARDQIRSSGFDVVEAENERAQYKALAIKTIPFNEMVVGVQAGVVSWSSSGGTLKKPNMLKTYGMMAVKAAISYALPWVGVGMFVFGFLKKKKKPKMAIPWADIYSQALPIAQKTTVDEEVSRITEEKQQTEQIRTVAIEKRSAEAAQFKLPEGVIGINRGALVMALKGGSVEKRI